MAFVTMATVGFFSVGTKTQRIDRFYTQAQTDLRSAMLHLTRTVRHGSGVQMASGWSNFAAAPDSNAAQVIVAVPQSGASGTDYIRIYRNTTTGAIYAQRQDDAGVGTKLMDGPSTLTLNYFATTATSTGTSTSIADAAPGSATEVQVSLTTTRGGATTASTAGTVTTKTVAYIAMRNTLLSL